MFVELGNPSFEALLASRAYSEVDARNESEASLIALAEEEIENNEKSFFQIETLVKSPAVSIGIRKYIASLAVLANRRDLLEVVYSYGSLEGSVPKAIIASAVEFGCVEALAFLRERGVVSNQDFDRAVELKAMQDMLSIEVLAADHEEGGPGGYGSSRYIHI